MLNIPLRKIPYESWEKEYEKILLDPFIKRKYDRERRLKDKLEYINKWTPEVLEGNGLVIDIGPGPGEYLELCRYFGNLIQGFDAKIDLSMMGNNYTSLCKLMADRQEIPIVFDDFINILQMSNEIIKKESVTIINSQGSIEQVFRRFINFPDSINKEGWIPSHNGYWVQTEECQKTFNSMFEKFNDWLRPSGKIIFYPNGSKNNEVFDKIISNSLDIIKSLVLVECNSDKENIVKIIRKIK